MMLSGRQQRWLSSLRPHGFSDKPLQRSCLHEHRWTLPTVDDRWQVSGRCRQVSGIGIEQLSSVQLWWVLPKMLFLMSAFITSITSAWDDTVPQLHRRKVTVHRIKDWLSWPESRRREGKETWQQAVCHSTMPDANVIFLPLDCRVVWRTTAGVQRQLTFVCSCFDLTTVAQHTRHTSPYIYILLESHFRM